MVLHTVSHLMPLAVCAGKVSILEDSALDSFHSQISKPVAGDDGDPKLRLTAHDIYKELRLRGYDYGKTFQGILESNNAGVCLSEEKFRLCEPLYEGLLTTGWLLRWVICCSKY